MGVETDVATSLQNVAFWDYWENTDWAVSIGVGGTRVQVISGWFRLDLVHPAWPHSD